MRKTIIIGAGVSGLSAAHFLKTPYTVLEAKSFAGGLCASFCKNGFTFDCSGHFIHARNEQTKKLIDKLCSGINKITRKASIYMDMKFIPFPFQANLFYLDEKKKKECIKTLLQIKDGTTTSTHETFLKWSNATFGTAITKYFMHPYNRKLWDYDLNKMTADWCGEFVPNPDITRIIRSAYSKNKIKYGYNSEFFYPKSGGCQTLINGFLKEIKVSLNSKVIKIDVKNKEVLTEDKQKHKYDKIISTQSVTELIKQIPDAPTTVKNASNKLIACSVRCINIGVKSKHGIPKILKDKHWIYVPEKVFPFYRFGIYSNVNKFSAPKDSYSFYVEFSSINRDYKNSENVLNDLKHAGFIGLDDKIVVLNSIEIPNAYVIYDNNREKAILEITSFLNKHDIYSIGRYGAWEYSFIEKNIEDAHVIAKHINSSFKNFSLKEKKC
ncbi:MAG: FAD-dependent oxidoreductase [Elusimicrobiota bacterium]|jgi:protoporphyrinogen oxidase|nr:FAD-dependent oxidoreductase [Elusimicrobiota bacterium]